jgi:hypothetical protein
MGQSKRYSVRANPQIKGGPMVTMSFRAPQAIRTLLEERVAELAADETEDGVENLTDALQDAVAKWCIMEGK